jgi:predicted negative regulator of RcsB-dependent stress response
VKPLDELPGEMLLTLGRSDEAAVAFAKSLQGHPNRKLSREGRSASRSR